jgi:peptidoglycan-associated lipoprotein
MKLIALTTLTLSLLFIGCSDPKPAVDDANKAKKVQKKSKKKKKSNSHADGSVPENKVLVREDNRLPAANNDLQQNGTTGSENSNEFDLESAKVYFSFDKFNIREDMNEVVESAFGKIENLEVQQKVKIEGNCDEWGTDEYNYALGLKRAKSVKNHLVKLGVDASRLSLISYGESNPLCNDKSNKCWSDNRRVEFKVLP